MILAFSIALVLLNNISSGQDTITLDKILLNWTEHSSADYVAFDFCILHNSCAESIALMRGGGEI